MWRTGALIENFDNIDTYELIENTNNNSAGNNASAASAGTINDVCFSSYFRVYFRWLWMPSDAYVLRAVH